MSEEEKKTQNVESGVSDDNDNSHRRRRRRVVQNLKCPLCESGVKHVSYKDIFQLKKFTSVRGKIISSEKSGLCHRHQKQLRQAIKRARFMALLPYVADE
ncbi:MAG: 30S ribosomal protein S18 [candidate division WS6 bacterium 34_10]|jgi:small subunit ribosomal protein S18|uniref:Small ribosomal subunit protein bS18 n=1 Tax=candidate division WS6 bacterium 34_10 TaxID=1641389 RepID=A0A101HHB6_9BACT|nr:MAG: 30S ribosomal protein S18 [candidate division WS6 bacterium 34_10]